MPVTALATASNASLSASTPLPISVIHDHDMLLHPGGPVVIGSSAFSDATPQWVDLQPFMAGRTTVTEEQWCAVMGGPAENPGFPKRQISWHDSRRFFEIFNVRYSEQFGFLTEPEWEALARGPAVNLRELMKTESVNADNFADWVNGRFENFVTALKMGATIYTDPACQEFQNVLRATGNLFGWRVFATPSGAKEDIWIAKAWERGPLPAHSGTPNAHGAFHMSGGVLEWVADVYNTILDAHSPVSLDASGARVMRGGYWYNTASYARTAYRHYEFSANRRNRFGLRVGRPVLHSENH